MKIRHVIIGSILFVNSFLVSHSGYAAIISGTISNWEESGPVLTIGDGTNHVSLWWSINTTDRGWFYGSAFTSDSDVAFATGVTDISQITDASIFSFDTDHTGPHCDADCDPDGVGDFIIWQNTSTGHFGVLRIDDIFLAGSTLLDAQLTGTWWFQTDGTGNFSAVPLPASLPFLLSGLAAFRLMASRKARCNKGS
jgi:hypothetical protein